MKFVQTVLLLLLITGCTTPPKEPPAGSHPRAEAPERPTAPSSPAAASFTPPSSAISRAMTSATAEPGPAPRPALAATKLSSAYGGCGEPIPNARLWDETTEAEVQNAIAEAKGCAAAHGRRLLLEFVAPWCADCQEMARLDAAPAVARALRERFERVRVNIGKWDRHEALRESFAVRALATYIVIDPKNSKLLARTTLEPITRRGHELTAEDWRRWLSQH